jgi:hypothetical protein
MGLDLLAAKFLVGEMRRGTVFSRTLTLGRQEINMSPNHISARRVRISPVFSRFPQQSDYQRAWLVGGSTANPSPGMLGPWKSRLIARSPFLAWLQDVWRRKKIARANKINRAPWAKRLPQKNGIPLSPS